MTRFRIPKLVVILDRAGSRGEITEVAAAAVQGGADIVQIREKEADEQEVAELTRLVLGAVNDPEKIAVNGFPAIATALGTHLHVPESSQVNYEDLELAPNRLLSRSIHGPAPDLVEDYAILGNVLESGTKPGTPGLGYEVFGEYARTTSRPVLGIGGITPVDVVPVLAAGGYGVAVRSYIIGSSDPERAAREFRAELDK